MGFARAWVADLRGWYARYAGDAGIEALLLCVLSRFAAMWAEREGAVRRRLVKRVDHPVGGWLAP